MEITLQTSETLFSLTIGGRLFTCTHHEAEALEATLRAAADQLARARAHVQAQAVLARMQRPDYWPAWSISQGLTVLTRDGYLTDQGVIRLVGKFAQEDGRALPFSWLTWLGLTWHWDRFRQAIPGLGDKRIRILRDALIAFLEAHPDQIYTGRRP